MFGRDRRSTGYLLGAALALGALQCGGPVAKRGAEQGCRGGKIWHRDDLARVRGCRQIDGTLELGGALDAALGLDELQTVRGDLIVGPSYQLDNLSSLAALVTVEGDLRIEGNWRLRGVFLPMLQIVGGRMSIRNNSGLINCAFGRLRSFAALQVDGNRRLQRVELRGLDSVGAEATMVGPSLSDVIAPDRIRWQKTSSVETRAKGS